MVLKIFIEIEEGNESYDPLDFAFEVLESQLVDEQIDGKIKGYKLEVEEMEE